ncbi:hypothetical protein SLEP1_g4403 [Rubroshorea leprosula]|uniref:Uncharacterized protein n=1 Tax=Rubroshorea leprosula TaxID=152421 RepID=A0AAV5HXG6_9ROSI|nr:hypothetical protein SLEP1_g4403 [Rubroshorea leprosula]
MEGSSSSADGDRLYHHKWRSNFGTQMAAWLKELEEICALVSSRGGFGFWGFWDLDKVSGKRWDCCQFLYPAFLDGFDMCLPVWSSVDNGFLELLASGRAAHNSSKGLAMAHLPRPLYVWPGSGHGRNWTSGEANILAD